MAARFRAIHLGGGGYIKCGTEANLALTEMAQAGPEIRIDLDAMLDTERRTVER